MDNKSEEVYDFIMKSLFRHLNDLDTDEDRGEFILTLCGSIIHCFTETHIEAKHSDDFIDAVLNDIGTISKKLIAERGDYEN